MDALSALIFMVWGFFLACCSAVIIALRIRKNYAFSCDNIHCQNMPDYLVTIFSVLAGLSIGLLIILKIILSGWNDMLILVIFVMVTVIYVGISFWRNAVARKNEEESPEETCGCGHHHEINDSVEEKEETEK